MTKSADKPTKTQKIKEVVLKKEKKVKPITKETVTKKEAEMKMPINGKDKKDEEKEVDK